MTAATKISLEDILIVGAACALILLQVRLNSVAEEGGDRIDSWTGFRFVLALAIFVEHSGVFRISCAGCFLLLSGAVLGLSKKKVTGLKTYLLYVLRRFSRIYPAYWLATLATHSPSYLLSHWKMLFAIHDTMYLWFIKTVLVLYLVFPLISGALDCFGTRESVRRCLSLACVCYFVQILVTAYAIYAPGPQNSNYPRPVLGVQLRFYTDPLIRLPQFTLGIILGHTIQALPKDAQCRRWLSLLTDAAMAFWILLEILAVVADLHNPCLGECTFRFLPLFSRFFLWSPIIFVLLLGLAASPQTSFTSTYLSQPLVTVLGTWSFGVYLWGAGILRLNQLLAAMDNSNNGSRLDLWFKLASLYAATLLASAASFILVESPITNCVARFSKKLEDAQSNSAAKYGVVPLACTEEESGQYS